MPTPFPLVGDRTLRATLAFAFRKITDRPMRPIGRAGSHFPVALFIGG